MQTIKTEIDRPVDKNYWVVKMPGIKVSCASRKLMQAVQDALEQDLSPAPRTL
jgi:hypothetical protein